MAQTSTTLSGEKSHIEDVTGTDISFNATDWTLPADFEPGNLVHNIGDILKPTR